jgi:hypothetical protein
VDHAEGLIDPPPAWVRVMLAAKWMGVAPWRLIAHDEIWTDWALLLRELELQRDQRESRGREQPAM